MVISMSKEVRVNKSSNNNKENNMVSDYRQRKTKVQKKTHKKFRKMRKLSRGKTWDNLSNL